MKKAAGNKILKAVTILAFLCIAYLIYATSISMSKAIVANNNLKKFLDAQFHLDKILFDIQEIESNQRNYILTGEEKYQMAFSRGMNVVRKDTVYDEKLSLHEESFKRKYEDLVLLIAKKITSINFAIALKDSFGIDSATEYISIGAGKLLMDSVNSAMVKLKDETRDKLSEANVYRNNFIREAFVTFS
ncbi:MAG: CHASE3 domain-containing protein, partial [Ferruginibacter sp.]